MDTVRDILAGVLAVAAAVMLTLWAPAAWVRDTVVDEAGFLSVAQPLGSQDSFRTEVADTAVTAVLDQIDVPRPVRSLVQPALQDAAQSLARDPVFGTIWDGSMKDLHTAIMSPQGGAVTADLNPYADALLKPVSERLGITIDLPETDALSLTIVTVPPSPWAGRLQAAADAASWIGWAGLGAAVLSVLVASRRGVLGFVLGLVVALGGVALLAGSRVAGIFVPTRVADSPILGSLVEAFEQRLAADLLAPAVIVIGGGAAVMALAIVVIGVAAGRRRPVAD